MPLRFRKSFKILPGIKINLSKSGISTSLGGRGASVNFGKRGIRTTVGLPGTGISYSAANSASMPRNTAPRPPSIQRSTDSSTNNSGCLNGLINLIALPFRVIADLIKSLSNPTTRKSTAILIGVLAGVCILCIGVTNIADGGSKGTPTPTIDINAIGTNAMMEAWSLYTQTAAALPTDTSVPTIEPTITETSTPLPTATLMPTNTPIPTFTFVPVVPTESHPAGATAKCNDGSYSFSKHRRGSCSGHNGVAYWIEILPP